MKDLNKNTHLKNELHQLSFDYLILINKDKIHQLRDMVSQIENDYKLIKENYSSELTIYYPLCI